MNNLTNFFFPSFCALCETQLTGKNELRFGLCDECRNEITLSEESRCSICGKPLISCRENCLKCRKEKENYSFKKLWALYPYMGKFKKLLSAYKFEKKLPLANFFAENILQIINSDPKLQEAVIVPVPPRPGKVKNSGWDQVDYLVKKIAGKKLAVSGCLRRKKSKIQKSLNRNERLENLKGKIYLRGDAPKTVLVIDDVITTGSTIEVCCNTLKKAGAINIYGLCLFYD